MRQFISGTDAAFDELADRARRACICFDAQEMPAGTQPSKARVGFEVDPRSGGATLLVQRGLAYSGSNEQVGDWLRSGRKDFDAFTLLQAWIRTELAACYETGRPKDELVHEPVPHTQPTRSDEPDAARPVDNAEGELLTDLSRIVRSQAGALRDLARSLGESVRSTRSSNRLGRPRQGFTGRPSRGLRRAMRTR